VCQQYSSQRCHLPRLLERGKYGKTAEFIGPYISLVANQTLCIVDIM